MSIYSTYLLSWESVVRLLRGSSKNLTCKTTKARKHASLVFRRFFRHSNPQCLKQLYMSFVWRHLEYAAPVWSPHLTTQIISIGNVQKFALHMCHKAWQEQYTSLLERSRLQSLADRRKLLDICYLYRVLTGIFKFPDALLEPRNPGPRLRTLKPQQLCQPFTRTLHTGTCIVISYRNSLSHSACSTLEFKHFCCAFNLFCCVLTFLYFCVNFTECSYFCILACNVLNK